MDECSLWEFAEAIDGWKRAQGMEEKEVAPTPDEFYDMVARLG